MNDQNNEKLLKEINRLKSISDGWGWIDPQSCMCISQGLSNAPCEFRYSSNRPHHECGKAPSSDAILAFENIASQLISLGHPCPDAICDYRGEIIMEWEEMSITLHSAHSPYDKYLDLELTLNFESDESMFYQVIGKWNNVTQDLLDLFHRVLSTPDEKEAVLTLINDLKKY